MTELGYGDFGRLFVSHVVTPERVRDTMWSLAGGDLTTGVRLAGGVVRAEGRGRVHNVAVERKSHDPLAYHVTLQASLDLTIRVAGVPSRYEGELAIPLRLRVATHDDLTLEIEIADVGAEDIGLHLVPAGTTASLIEQIGQVDAQVRREVAQIVNVRKDGDDAWTFRRIDIGPAIDSEWQRRQRRSEGT